MSPSLNISVIPRLKEDFMNSLRLTLFPSQVNFFMKALKFGYPHMKMILLIESAISIAHTIKGFMCLSMRSSSSNNLL